MFKRANLANIILTQMRDHQGQSSKTQDALVRDLTIMLVLNVTKIEITILNAVCHVYHLNDHQT